MTLNEIIALIKYHLNTFGDRLPVCFTKGEGMKLWDKDGKGILRFSCRYCCKCPGAFSSGAGKCNY